MYENSFEKSGSSLDHSCEPNCTVLFNGSKMLVKVIKKFEKNIQQVYKTRFH
jgi:hypothetical protein